MRYEFATLFDRRYLPRGLVLYRSLQAHCHDFRLWAFCMDWETELTLQTLALPSVAVIGLPELEAYDSALASVKATRARIEYYWTATPAICRFALEREPSIDHIIHVDADVEFYADPAPLFGELGDGSVLLTPHRLAPEFAGIHGVHGEIGGRFNVQFELFRRDRDGLGALNWWRERCIEWCYDRYGDSRYGDQKYLDDFPRRFRRVSVTTNPGAGLAPWNVGAHHLERSGGRLVVDGRPLIFHHFQSLELHPVTRVGRMLARGSTAYRLTDGPMPLIWTTGWRLTPHQLEILWDPYLARLSKATAEVAAVAGLEVVKPPALHPPRVAFHLLRRHSPQLALSVYWRARKLRWRQEVARLG